MPNRIYFLSSALLRYVSITTSSLAQLQKHQLALPEGTYFLWNFLFFFLGSIKFDCRVSSSTQTAACLVEPAGRGSAAVPQRNQREGTKRKSIRATLAQSINYLQCHVVRGCRRSRRSLNSLLRKMMSPLSVMIRQHSSTVGEIWMSPTSTRSTFI